MSVAEVHLCHVYSRVGVGDPEKATAEVSVEPFVGTPVGAVVDTTCGATGAAFGVTGFDAADGDDDPPELIAVDVHVYSTPFVRPVIEQEPPAPVTVHVAPPGEAVTVYEVGTPPVFGTVTVTVPSPLPATAVGAGGVPGAGGITVTVLVETSERFPAASTAYTL
jgi:hypothetical protein